MKNEYPDLLLVADTDGSGGMVVWMRKDKELSSGEIVDAFSKMALLLVEKFVEAVDDDSHPLAEQMGEAAYHFSRQLGLLLTSKVERKSGKKALEDYQRGLRAAHNLYLQLRHLPPEFVQAVVGLRGEVLIGEEVSDV